MMHTVFLPGWLVEREPGVFPGPSTRVVIVGVSFDENSDGLNCSPGNLPRGGGSLTFDEPPAKRMQGRFTACLQEQSGPDDETEAEPSFRDELAPRIDAAFRFLAKVPFHPFFDMPVDTFHRTCGEGFIGRQVFRMRSILELEKLRRPKSQRERQESRAIVSRKSDARIPTWDGTRPAFVVDPAIWYFDPRLERQEIRLSEALVGGKFSIVALSNVAQPVPRRTYLEYLLTDAPLEVPPEMYGSVRLFR